MENSNGRVQLNAHYLKNLIKNGLSQKKLSSLCLDSGINISLSSIKRAES